MVINRDERNVLYLCDNNNCNYVTNREAKLNAHVASCNVKINRIYFCKYVSCLFATYNKKQMKLHRISHKLRTCRECNSTFIDRNKFDIHKRCHILRNLYKFD